MRLASFLSFSSSARVTSSCARSLSILSNADPSVTSSVTCLSSPSGTCEYKHSYNIIDSVDVLKLAVVLVTATVSAVTLAAAVALHAATTTVEVLDRASDYNC
jgi:hypothetical protein